MLLENALRYGVAVGALSFACVAAGCSAAPDAARAEIEAPQPGKVHEALTLLDVLHADPNATPAYTGKVSCSRFDVPIPPVLEGLGCDLGVEETSSEGKPVRYLFACPEGTHLAPDASFGLLTPAYSYQKEVVGSSGGYTDACVSAAPPGKIWLMDYISDFNQNGCHGVCGITTVEE